MSQVNLNGFGYLQSVDVTGAKTLAATDCGTVQNVTATCTITLPATYAGENHVIRVGADDITVTIAPNASDKIAGNGFTATDAKSVLFTDAPIGSFVELGANADGWTVNKLHDPASVFTRAA
jgi:hypothetical protein